MDLITDNMQWYAEVLHFCRDVPILLVGCKKDLRYDNKVIEELAKTSQTPVSPEQVGAEMGGFDLANISVFMSTRMYTRMAADNGVTLG